MSRSFHASAVSLNLGMTAYLLTLAVFIPISGWVADRWGARTVFATAIGVFTLASLLCAGAHTLTQFTCARILQGVGGAMMVPVGRLVVLRATPKERLTQAIAYITWPGLSALVLGPALGGFITTYFSWHWIFLLNAPLGIVALLLTLFWIENTRTTERHPFDLGTFLLAGFASAGAVYSAETLGGGDPRRWHVPALIFLASLLSGVAAILHARRRPETSLIDFRSLGLKSFSISIYGASAFRIAVNVLPFLLPLLFQIVFGLSAFHSGLYLLALFAGDLSMKSIVIPILRRWGFRQVLLVNGCVAALSVALCALLTPHTHPLLIVALLAFHGGSRSLEFTCLTTLAYTEIPAERMSRANGFLSAVMQLSAGAGVAAGAVTLRLCAHAHHHSAAAPHLADFQVAFLVVSLLALGPVLDSLGLAPEAGAATSGHRQPRLEHKAA
jgi:EmrB/QacA subfamily drug resistance transporter